VLLLNLAVLVREANSHLTESRVATQLHSAHALELDRRRLKSIQTVSALRGCRLLDYHPSICHTIAGFAVGYYL